MSAGLGGELAGLIHYKVEPECPFVRNYIEEHPEYADLVAK